MKTTSKSIAINYNNSVQLIDYEPPVQSATHEQTGIDFYELALILRRYAIPKND